MVIAPNYFTCYFHYDVEPSHCRYVLLNIPSKEGYSIICKFILRNTITWVKNWFNLFLLMYSMQKPFIDFDASN